MTVSRKLFVILVFVALAPLGVFALTALGEHERALDAELAKLHRKTAEQGARSLDTALATTRRMVAGLAGAIPWAALASGDEREGALVLVYEQLDDIAIAALRDEHGNDLGAIYRATTADRHPKLDRVAIDGFARALAAPQGDGQAAVIAGQPPIVPIIVPVAGPGGAKWSLAIGLSLRGACDELGAASPPEVATRLETAGGQLLCGTRTAATDVLTATAEVTNGWRVTAEQPTATALASLHEVRRQSVVWIALGVAGALLAGAVLTQAIRKPLRQLTAGAEALAAGDLAHRVPDGTQDEFGALATSFNKMSSEIKSWREELQQRVDARTAELKEAQEQLLQSRKLGAVAALAAGVAHEINNPLTGVVGLAQVLVAKKDRFDERTQKSLQSIEREALRIREIVDRMASLAQASVGNAVRLDLKEVIEAATTQHAAQLAAAKIEVEHSFPAGVPQILGNASQLQHAIGQLVDNSLHAMPEGGRLRVAVRSIEDELVAIDVEDTGRGISPEIMDKIFEPFFTTKENWRGAGLGLAIAHRIVEAHQGRIRAASKMGAGTTMTVTLPAARRAAHLA
jgi:signal transduction histidine kinase